MILLNFIQSITRPAKVQRISCKPFNWGKTFSVLPKRSNLVRKVAALVLVLMYPLAIMEVGLNHTCTSDLTAPGCSQSNGCATHVSQRISIEVSSSLRSNNTNNLSDHSQCMTCLHLKTFKYSKLNSQVTLKVAEAEIGIKPLLYSSFIDHFEQLSAIILRAPPAVIS
jgi:hypothetical protein